MGNQRTPAPAAGLSTERRHGANDAFSAVFFLFARAHFFPLKSHLASSGTNSKRELTRSIFGRSPVREARRTTLPPPAPAPGREAPAPHPRAPLLPAAFLQSQIRCRGSGIHTRKRQLAEKPWDPSRLGTYRGYLYGKQDFLLNKQTATEPNSNIRFPKLSLH